MKFKSFCKFSTVNYTWRKINQVIDNLFELEFKYDTIRDQDYLKESDINKKEKIYYKFTNYDNAVDKLLDTLRLRVNKDTYDLACSIRSFLSHIGYYEDGKFDNGLGPINVFICNIAWSDHVLMEIDFEFKGVKDENEYRDCLCSFTQAIFEYCGLDPNNITSKKLEDTYREYGRAEIEFNL